MDDKPDQADLIHGTQRPALQAAAGRCVTSFPGLAQLTTHSRRGCTASSYWHTISVMNSGMIPHASQFTGRGSSGGRLPFRLLPMFRQTIDDCSHFLRLLLYRPHSIRSVISRRSHARCFRGSRCFQTPDSYCMIFVQRIRFLS